MLRRRTNATTLGWSRSANRGSQRARRRVARLISAPSDAMLCKKQSQLAWARLWLGGSASSTTRARLLRRLTGSPAS
jgi:hypothetical protein